MVIDLVAEWDDVDPASEMTESVRRALAAAPEASRRSVAAMHDLGWPVRDIASAPGVSHQRASQLARDQSSEYGSRHDQGTVAV